MTARVRAALKFLIGLAVLVVVVWWVVPGPAERQALLARLRPDPLWLLLGFAANFVASVVTSARWQLMTEEAMGGTRLPYVAYFHSLVLTRVLGQVSSTLVMDLVGRGVALRSAGSRHGLGHAVTQAIIERIFDIVLPLMMLAWAIAAWQGGWDAGLAAGSFALVCVAFAGLAAVMLAPLTRLALRIYAALRRLRARRRVAVATRDAPRDADRDAPRDATRDATRDAPRDAPRDASRDADRDAPRDADPNVPGDAVAAAAAELAAGPIPLPRGLAVRIGMLSLLRYLAVLAMFWTLALGIGVDISALQIAAAAPIGQIAGMAGFTPGALGIQEAGWLGALTWVGLDAPAIGLFVICQRLISTAYFSVLSLLSWLILRRTRAPAPP